MSNKQFDRNVEQDQSSPAGLPGLMFGTGSQTLGPIGHASNLERLSELHNRTHTPSDQRRPGALGYHFKASLALNESSRPDTLHIMGFMEITDAEIEYILKIRAYAKTPPKRMEVIINGGRPHGLANHTDLQNAISDPRMRGTIVISHGSPQGKIWEQHGVAMCPAGFKGNAQYPCALTMMARPPGPRPQWVLLAGCHMGASEEAWKRTFGNPLMLDGSEVYTTGGESSLRGTNNDTESTIPKLRAVMDWLKDYKSDR